MVLTDIFFQEYIKLMPIGRKRPASSDSPVKWDSGVGHLGFLWFLISGR